MSDGLYTCNLKCGKSFDSLNLKNAHMMICRGNIDDVVPDDSQQSRNRNLLLQDLPTPHEAPAKAL
jgi:hypothetical protein